MTDAATVEAAVADAHRHDWPRVLAATVVALNHSVPMAMTAGPQAALAEVERLDRDGRLASYQYLPAIRADLLARLGRADEAAAEYRRALALTGNQAERAFLAEQIKGLNHHLERTLDNSRPVP